MAGAIQELATDKEKAVGYGQEARQRALIRHSIDKLINEIGDLY